MHVQCMSSDQRVRPTSKAGTQEFPWPEKYQYFWITTSTQYSNIKRSRVATSIPPHSAMGQSTRCSASMIKRLAAVDDKDRPQITLTRTHTLTNTEYESNHCIHVLLVCTSWFWWSNISICMCSLQLSHCFTGFGDYWWTSRSTHNHYYTFPLIITITFVAGTSRQSGPIRPSIN